MDAGNQSHVVALTLFLSELFCFLRQLFLGHLVFAQAVGSRVISRILHRQLSLLCNHIFLIVSIATFVSCHKLVVLIS